MRKVPLYMQILAAMALGALTGLLIGPRASALGELGRVVITLIKTLAAPLIFFAVVDAFLRAEVRARSAALMVAISLVNAALALGIGLSISNLLRPGEHLSLNLPHAPADPGSLVAARKIDFVRAVTEIFPANIVQPFLESSALGIIVLALLLGAALRKVKNERGGRLPLEDSVATLLRGTEIMIGWIVRLVPLAVFGVVAKMTGAQGLAPFKGLAVYVGVALLGLGLQIGVVYQLWIVLALGASRLRGFWRGARDPVVYALGASSSLATLPVTLGSLDRMGVSVESARLAACVGTNLNHDGILLYEAMAVLFVAQAHGIHLSLSQQIMAALSCLVAGIGIAGIPDAGLISLSLVLATVGLPVEILPWLLTVDWVLSRGRAITNVLSDMLLAQLLDRFSKRA